MYSLNTIIIQDSMSLKTKLFSFIILQMLLSPALFAQTSKTPNEKNKKLISPEKDNKASKADTDKIDFAFLSNSIKYDTISFKNREELFDLIASLRSMSGAIFFTGAGFPNLVSVTFVSKKKIPDHVIDRCVPGTKLMFQKFMVKNDDGTQLMLSKSIYLK